MAARPPLGRIEPAVPYEARWDAGYSANSFDCRVVRRVSRRLRAIELTPSGIPVAVKLADLYWGRQP